MVRAPLFDVEVAGEFVEAALGLLELPGENGHLPGMILQPLIPPEVGTGSLLEPA